MNREQRRRKAKAERILRRRKVPNRDNLIVGQNTHVGTLYRAKQMRDGVDTINGEVYCYDLLREVVDAYGYTLDDVQKWQTWWGPFRDPESRSDKSAGLVRVRAFMKGRVWCLYHESKVATHSVNKLYKVRIEDIKDLF